MRVAFRNRGGATLIAVIGIGLISSLWLSALMGVVLPSYNRAATGRTEIALRSASEAALDWAVATLNTPGNSIDDTSENGIPGPLVTVPASILGEYGMKTTATVQVNNRRPPAGSYVYDPTVDPSNGNTNGGIWTNGWRVVTAVSKCGKMTKTIRVLLKPTYTAQPFFNYALFARTRVRMNGSSNSDSYDSTIGYAGSQQNLLGDVGSNALVEMTGNSTVGGNVKVLSNPPGGNNEVVYGTSGATIRGTLVVNGRIHLNGSNPDFHSSNVNGILPDGSTASNPIQQQQFNPQKNLPASPAPSSSAVDLGALIVNGNQTFTLQAPGDYIVSSIQITGNGKIKLEGTGQVRVFVQGASTNIAIAGNGIVNGGRPQDFQLYYNGTGSTAISGNGSFTGVVYAPNSNVSISGNGHVYGAMVGHTITMNDGSFHYDRSLVNLNNAVAMTLSRRQTVSWQEL